MDRRSPSVAGGWTAVLCSCLIAARAAAASPPTPAIPASVISAPAPAPVPPPRPRYFYFGFDYGSQSLYSPLWVFLNRGYDVLQDHVATRNIFEQRYRVNTGNVLDNLAHPFANIGAVGWKPFLTEEIFPLRFGGQSARWVPNYTLHLIGGGTTYTALAEWFDDRAVPLPHLWSGLTLMAAALVNETIENKGVVGPNTDALADLYVFDVAAMILFSFEAPNRFFSRVLVVSDWSLQPSFTFPRGQLHDQGNNFAAKWALPFYPRLRLFSFFGMATEAGLSYLIDDEYSVTAAVGQAATRLVNETTRRAANVVTFARTAGAYVDRRDSLLASLQITDVSDYFVTFNLYPHAVWRRGPALGAWTVVDKHAHVALGLSISRLLGVGLGWSGL